MHIAGGAGPRNNYNQYRIDQIQEIANYIKAHKQKSRYWIVCGDFNIDSRTNPALYKTLLATLQTSGIQFVDAIKKPLATRVSAYSKGVLENLDYIFHSNNFTKITNTLSHDDNDNMEDKLLTHGYGTGDNHLFETKTDSERGLESDHTGMYASFTITIPAKAQAPAIRKPAAAPTRKIIPQAAALKVLQKIVPKPAPKKIVGKPHAPVKKMPIQTAAPRRIVKPGIGQKQQVRPILQPRANPVKPKPKKLVLAKPAPRAIIPKAPQKVLAVKKTAVQPAAIQSFWPTLERVIANDNLPAVKFLVPKYITKTMKNPQGKTPLDLAKKYNKPAILKYLQTT